MIGLDHRGDLGSGSTVAVSTMRKLGHQVTVDLAVLLGLVDGDLGDDGEVALRFGFGQGDLAVEEGEEMLVMAGEDEIGGAVADQRHVDVERRVDDGDDEVDAGVAERLGLGDAGLDATERR